MHDGAAVRGVLDYAGDADTHAEELFRCDVGGGEDLGYAVADVADDDLDLVALLLQRAFGAGEFGECEVEHLDADAGLADVDADHVAAARGDLEQGAGTAAVGVDAAGLDQTVGDEVRDDIAHRAGTEPGRRAQFEAAEGSVEVQPLQHGRTVGPPEVAYRAPVPPRHVAPSEPRTRLIHALN